MDTVLYLGNTHLKIIPSRISRVRHQECANTGPSLDAGGNCDETTGPPTCTFFLNKDATPPKTCAKCRFNRSKGTNCPKQEADSLGAYREEQLHFSADARERRSASSHSGGLQK